MVSRELFHDQGDDLAAANVLELLLKSADGNTNSATASRIASTLQRLYLFRKNQPTWNHRSHHLRSSRTHVLFASLSLGARRRATKTPRSLEKALAQEPGDVDVLIACYRLPDQKPNIKIKSRN